MNSEYHAAQSLARLMHGGQVDKAGRPVYDHVRRVSYGVASFQAATVALLHDLLEDTKATQGDLLRLGFSAETVQAVVVLTRLPGQTYADYTLRVKEHGGIAVEVKLADLADHLAPRGSYVLPESLERRYRDAIAVLEES